MEKYKKQLIKIIKKYLPKCTIYLFGSRARGKYSYGSDIDLALDAGLEIDYHVIGQIKEEIENTNIPFSVDIVDMLGVSEKIKKQIFKDGVIWKI